MKLLSVFVLMMLGGTAAAQASVCEFDGLIRETYGPFQIRIEYADPKIPTYLTMIVSGPGFDSQRFNFRDVKYNGPSKGYNFYEVTSRSQKMYERAELVLEGFPQGSHRLAGRTFLRHISIKDKLTGGWIASLSSVGLCEIIWPNNYWPTIGPKL